MGKIDYKKLYALQDEVLKIVFSNNNEFILQVGHALVGFIKLKDILMIWTFFQIVMICLVLK